MIFSLFGLNALCCSAAKKQCIAKAEWNHRYDQTLVMKLILSVPDLKGGTNVSLTFANALEMVKRIDMLTLQSPKIIYLVGWQYNGHDDKYPAFFEANPALKRSCDRNANESLLWLMKEAKKYHTTISLHINMTDAYEDSPLWKTYVDNDLISKNEDGSLMVIGSYNNRKAYQINYKNEWGKGFAQMRIDSLLKQLPLLRDAGTVHIDAWIARESKGHNESVDTEKEFQKKVCQLWLDRGIEPTSEWVMPYMAGLIPQYWHFNHRTQEDYLKEPASFCTGTHMNPDLKKSDFGLEFLFGTSLYGEPIFPRNAKNIDSVAWQKKFSREFYLNFVQYYFLNGLQRLSVAGNGSSRIAKFSSDVEVSLKDSTVTAQEVTLRSKNTLCMPIRWKKDRSYVAYSTMPTSYSFSIPKEWKGYRKADLYRVTVGGLVKTATIRLAGKTIMLKLAGEEPIVLKPMR